MKSTGSLVDLRAGLDGSPGEARPPRVTKRRQGGKTSAQAATRLSDAEARADAMASAAPFSTSPGGRRVIFKFDDSPYAYGVFSLVDGLTQGHDLVADGPVTVIRIPRAAIRAELDRMPSLWQTVAAEATRRARGMNMQMQQFVFDAPLVRAASLLLGLLADGGTDGEQGPVVIGLRVPKERLGELLGTSRQWATALVRELSQAGLVEWRYGRVTVLDVKALRTLAASGIGTMG